jgi:tRNA(fMet)-specific endonuclease VapC
MTYMFDTNIISYLIRGSSLALKTRFENEAPENLAVSVVVYAEILYGIRKINGAKIASKIKAFLANMRIVDFKADAAVMYANIRTELDKTGMSCNNMDMLIAASAMAEGAVLVSHNIRHFSKINGLCLEDWF